MDNTTRSERSRKTILQAALTVVMRDGPRQLTFDAIARESGISKGGVMHQFPNKQAMLKGLLDYQIDHFEEFSNRYRAGLSAEQSEPSLHTQIATLRETVTNSQAIAHAILAALAEDPGLMSIVRDSSAERVEEIKAEASNIDLALIRRSAALGLALSTMFGLSPLTDAERERLFDYLLDDHKWK